MNFFFKKYFSFADTITNILDIISFFFYYYYCFVFFSLLLFFFLATRQICYIKINLSYPYTPVFYTLLYEMFYRL